MRDALRRFWPTTTDGACMVSVGSDYGVVSLHGKRQYVDPSLALIRDYFPCCEPPSDWDIGVCTSQQAISYITSLPQSLECGTVTQVHHMSDPTEGDFTVMFDTNDRRILFVAQPDSRQAEMILARAVRTIVYKEMRERGYFFLHAACVAKERTGVAILGQRHVGKTTTLINLVANGWDFVSNDKIALSINDRQLIADGFPVSAGIRAGTIEALVDVFASPEGREISQRPVGAGGRLRVPPRDIAALGPGSICTQCEIRALIVPVLDNTLTTPKFEQIDTVTSASFIERNQLSKLVELSSTLACLIYAGRPDRFMAFGLQTSISPVQISRSVPMYILRQGTQSNHLVSHSISQLLFQQTDT